MTSTSTIIEKSLAEHNQLIQEVIKDKELIETIAKVIEEIVNSYKKGGQLVIIMRVKRTFFANFYQSKI